MVAASGAAEAAPATVPVSLQPAGRTLCRYAGLSWIWGMADIWYRRCRYHLGDRTVSPITVATMTIIYHSLRQ